MTRTSRHRSFTYEQHHERVLPLRQFAHRVFGHFALATATIFAALGIGIVGYHFLARLAWVDALVNAAMILAGMGPIDPLPTTASKVFAAFYALFSGLLFIGVLGVVLAPFAHRLMHRLHVQDK